MFDIGFAELLLVAVVGLLVLGPERLPGAIRTTSLWLGRLRSSFNAIRAEIERELNTDEIKQDLHNEEVLKSLRQAEQDLRGGLALEEPSIAPPASTTSTTTSTTTTDSTPPDTSTPGNSADDKTNPS
jgi:sec-independent protein translocase protein TatB